MGLEWQKAAISKSNSARCRRLPSTSGVDRCHPRFTLPSLVAHAASPTRRTPPARIGESFFIQLPYGAGVDWCRNVLAAGHCTLERDGVLYDTVAPEIVPADEALPFLPAGLRRMQQLARVESYLRLDISSAENPAKKSG